MKTQPEDRTEFRSPKGIASWWAKDGAWHIALPCADPDPSTGLRTGGFRWTAAGFSTRAAAVAEINPPACRLFKLSLMIFSRNCATFGAAKSVRYSQRTAWITLADGSEFRMPRRALPAPCHWTGFSLADAADKFARAEAAKKGGK